MKKIILLLFVCIPLLSFAQEEKDYKITSYKIWDLWQDQLWTLTETVDSCEFTCHVHYDEHGIWGKFVLDHKIYHVYGELKKKEIDTDTRHVNYYATGKLVYENRDIEVTYWETFHELDSIQIFLEKRRVFFNLEDY